jgi:hypothetical protein
MSSSAIGDNTRPPSDGQVESFHFCYRGPDGALHHINVQATPGMCERICTMVRVGSAVFRVLSRAAEGLDLTQDNIDKVEVLRSLNEEHESTATIEAKRQSNQKGRLISSQVRRSQRNGIDRRMALRTASVYFGCSPQIAETFAKYHNRQRDQRVERMRRALLPKWRAKGMTNREIAERLNVTPQHVGRLFAEIGGAPRPSNPTHTSL